MGANFIPCKKPKFFTELIEVLNAYIIPETLNFENGKDNNVMIQISLELRTPD